MPILALFTCAMLIAAVGFTFSRAQAARDPVRRRTAVVRAIEHAAPAVVSVYADSRVRRNTLRRGAGSGVIIHPDGYIVTNAHVIEDGQRIHVQLFRDSRTLDCRVIVNWKKNDLALLKINGSGRRYPYVSLSPTCDVMLGETAIAIGNPRGLGDTITVGVISAIGRDAKMTSGTALRDLIQTDASINTGNSGGALLNLDGELIGVIVSLLPRASGIAFAIPCAQVQNLLRRGLRTSAPANSLPTDGPHSNGGRAAPRATSSTRVPERASPERIASTPEGRPSPGRAPIVRKRRTNPMRAADFGFNVRDTGSEMRIMSVEPGSRAALAGLRAGDTLLGVDGSPVEDHADLLIAFSRASPGQTYTIEVRRAGDRDVFGLVVPR